MVSLPPKHGAAIESYVCDLARLLAARGHSVSVVGDSSRDYNWGEIEICPVGTGRDRYLEPIPLRATRRPLAGFATARATLRLMESLPKGERAVIVMNEEVSAAMIARRLGSFRGARGVFVIHDPPPDLSLIRATGVESIVRDFAWRLTCRMILPRVKALVTLNPLISTYISSTTAVPPSACFSVPLAIDTDLFSPATSAEPPPGAEGLRIVYVGRIDERKNTALLVRAMKHVPEDVTLTLVGDGPLRNSLENWVGRTNLGGRVKFLGIVPESTLISVLRQSEVFVLPSSLEAFPRAALEAASCGLALLFPSSDLFDQYFSTGSAESFEAMNEKSLGEAIISLRENAARRLSLRAQARRFACEHCGYSAIGENFDRIFDYCWSG